ncbi:MAG: energy transducer TonB [Muribaculaceae bacterium]|nr:energy transducer TonB [Muribaculaceae bacterium]
MNRTVLSCLRMATALLAAVMLLMPTTADAQARKRKATTQVSKTKTTQANAASVPNNATPAVVETPAAESSSQTTVLDKSAPIYRSVEQMPQFPGGDAALLAYIRNHITYPDCNVQGKVVLQFVVETDGSVGEVKVVRSIAPDLDNEAMRVIKILPKFTPGRQNGQPARVWYTMPVGFNR